MFMSVRNLVDGVHYLAFLKCQDENNIASGRRQKVRISKTPLVPLLSNAHIFS